jgi:hypothetical protein
MGIKATDISPPQGPTALNPVSKGVFTKVFAIARTDTSATVKCVLPGDSTILDMRVFSGTASDAATTATISVGLQGGSGTYFLNTVDVKTAAGMIRPTTKLTNMVNLENIPVSGDITINGVYAETGTASTTGGPFYVIVDYVR